MRNLPREPIGTVCDHLGSYRVWLHCQCGHAKRFDPGELVARYGGELPNRRLVQRARCGRCGHRGATITVEPLGAHGYCWTPRSGP